MLVPVQSPLPVRKAAPQRGPSTAAGTTAVAALAEGDTMWLAHVGDSRAVLCEGGVAFPLTRDHTPELAEETQRVEKVHWSVSWPIGSVRPEGVALQGCERFTIHVSFDLS